MLRLVITVSLVLVWSCASSGDDVVEAYRTGPFAFLSMDYFERFSLDTEAEAGVGEVALGLDWEIVACANANPLTTIMAGHLAEFFEERMGLALPLRVDTAPPAVRGKAIMLSDHEAGDSLSDGAFTISVAADRVVVGAGTAAGLRDGIVELVNRMGFRAAPILALGDSTHSPRLATRVGAVPWLGSYRDVVFQGNNAVILTPEVGTRNYAAARLLELSSSAAIPELVPHQQPALLAQMAERAQEARQYGLKIFLPLRMWDFYPVDHPLFVNHPELRGAEALYFLDQPPAGFLLCTEAPLMRQYLSESIRGLFEAIPLDGVLVIIGGEEFQHCFMRPAGAALGHTNCSRCETIGADQVVANLCNGMAEAARQANPEGLLVAWPYSASSFWSVDADQRGLIERLGPGTALLTEVEKDETVTKEGGVVKLIWDYSIDFIGPTARAQRQIAAGKARGIPVFLKSEPELAFEAPGLPYIPCVDRWFERAEALAGSGADGAWVFPWFQAGYGATSAEVYKYPPWNPAPGKEALLAKLAARIAGAEAAPHLREAWAHVSEAVAWSPEQPPYYSGPYYLGPAHPIFADPEVELPASFQYGGKPSMHILRYARGDVEAFGRFYRNMESALLKAITALDAAQPLVPPRCVPVFQAEALPARWFYHTARTHANFYESAHLRELLTKFAAMTIRTPDDLHLAESRYERWRAVLADERENTLAALPVVDADPRLDFRNGAGRSLPPAAELMRAKLAMLDHDLDKFLPVFALACGIRQ